MARGHSSQIRHRNSINREGLEKSRTGTRQGNVHTAGFGFEKTSDPIKQTKVKLNEENVVVRTIVSQGNRNKLESIVEPMIKILLLVFLKESCYAKFNDRSTHI